MADQVQTVQTRRNFYTNILTLVVNIVVGFFYTPYLTRTLGPSAYGIVPLALIINQYISVVASALTSSFTRFYSVAIQKGDVEEATKTISTSMVVILVLIASLLPVLTFIVLRVDKVFSIPAAHVPDAKLLFLYTVLSFFLSMVTSLINVTLYATNRLDLMNVIKIVRRFFKLPLIILFFVLVEVNVKYIGVTSFIIEAFILVYSIHLFRSHRPEGVTIKLSRASRTVFAALFAMAVWNLVQYVGDTALYRIDNIVVNRNWGIVESGALGAITEMGNFINQVTGVIGSLFGPLIIIAYSKNRHDDVVHLSTSQSYIVGIITAVLAGVLAGFSAPVLEYWLGPKYPIEDQYRLWMVIKLSLTPFYAAGGVLSFTYRAWNRVRFPALATLVIGVMNIIALTLLVRLAAAPIWLLLMVSVVLGIVQSYFLGSYCVSKSYPESAKSLALSFVKFFATMAVVEMVCLVFCALGEVDSLGKLLAYGAVVGMAVAVLAYLVCFNKTQKQEVLSLLK